MADIYYRIDGDTCWIRNEIPSTDYTKWTEGTSVCSGKHVRIIPINFVFSFPTNASNLFKGMTNTDLSHLYPDNWSLDDCTNASHLFDGSSLVTVNFTKAFTNVTNFSYMFYNCADLTDITFPSSPGTDNVTTMANMFNGCSALKNIDLSKFTTTACTNYRGMFFNCTALETVNISNFEMTSSVSDVSNMFSGCTNLSEIDAGYLSRWFKVIPSSASTSGMFTGCTLLRNFDETKTDIQMADCFKDGYFKYYAPKVYYIINGPTGSSYCNRKLTSQYREMTFTTNINEVSYNRSVETQLTYGEFYLPESAGWLYYGSLNSSFNPRIYYAKECRSMQGMFAYCKNLTSFNCEFLDTSNIEIMWNMFEGCSSLTNITNLDKLDTSKCRLFSSMFENCSSLTRINDINKLDFSKATDANWMFAGCTKLVDMDLSGVDFSNLESCSHMFYNCTNLKEINFNGMKTTDKLRNIERVVYKCSSLEYVDLSNFNVSNVRDMYGLVANCANLEVVDILGWHPTKLSDCSYAFSQCPKLYAINADEGTDWDIFGSEGPNDGSMFRDSPSLINYDPEQISINKANNTRGGYFGEGHRWKIATVFMKGVII